MGRRELLNEISAQPGEPAACYAITGPPGVGKTTFVARLADELVRRRHHVVRIGLQTFRPRLEPDDEAGPGATIQRSFNQFCDLALALHERLGERRDDAFRDRVDAAKRSPVSVANPSVVTRSLDPRPTDEAGGDCPSPGTRSAEIPVGKTPVAAAVENLVREFTAHMGDRVAKLSARTQSSQRSRRLYILFDECDAIARDALATWVATMARSMRGAVVVLVGRPAMLVPDWAAARVLSNFTRVECVEYLRARCRPRLTDDIVEQIYAFTGGNPQAVDIIADLVARSGVAATVALIRSYRMAQPSAMFSDRMSELVEALLGAGQDPIPPEVISAVVVVRRFDSLLLRRLLQPGGLGTTVDNLHARVIKLPFVEPSMNSSGEVDAHRVHEFVRSDLLAKLENSDPHRCEQLHARAMAHYSQAIDQVKAQLVAENPFNEAVRYKEVRWRYLYSEWLYHVGHIGGTEKARARVMFADIFLDAFWWWGYYAPLAFCDDLLDEWSLVGRDPADCELNQQLGLFKDSYPVGWGTRDTADANWPQVMNSLTRVRVLGGLDIDEATSDPVLRHLRATTSLFLGEAAQSAHEGFAVSDRWYAEAQAMFDTDMGRDWTRLQRAEMWTETAHEGRAAELLEGLEERARRRGDDELLARLAKFTAGRRLANDLLPEAAATAVLAVLHAFVFHVRQTPAPDDYSTAFHYEIVQTAAETLASIEDQATQAMWQSVVAAVQQLLAPLSGHVQQSVPHGRVTSAMLVRLLPPPPAATDLYNPDSPYVRTASWVEGNMTDALAVSVSP